MKSIIHKISITFFFFSSYIHLSAQALINDAGEREKHFIYEVKQIDEFFERFNDDDNSFVRQVYAKYHIRYNLNRTKLIKSLFNYETKSWNAEDIDRFVNTAVNEQHPEKLDFYGDYWYAEVNCKFQQNETVIDITLVLKINADNMKRSKWVIAGVRSKSLKKIYQKVVIAAPKDASKFINPASHANNLLSWREHLMIKKI